MPGGHGCRAFCMGQKMEKFICVENWESYQHYKTRTPPWIKIYTRLIDLDAVEYSCLTDVQKLHLIHIWLLSSRHDNKIPLRMDWLQRRLNVTEKIDLQPLIDGGFITIVNEFGEPLDDQEKLFADEAKTKKAKQNPAQQKPKQQDALQIFADAFFENVFWPLYRKGCKIHNRRPGSKSMARDAMIKHVKDEPTREQIETYLNAWIQADEKLIRNGDFAPAWPDAHRWIKRKGWLDDLPTQESGANIRPIVCRSERCKMPAGDENLCSYHKALDSNRIKKGAHGFWRWYHEQNDMGIHPVRLWGMLGNDEHQVEKIMADERALGLPG